MLAFLTGCVTAPAPRVVEVPPGTKVIIVREVPYHSTWGVGIGWEWNWYRYGPGPWRHGRR